MGERERGEGGKKKEKKKKGKRKKISCVPPPPPSSTGCKSTRYIEMKGGEGQQKM